MTQVQGQAFGPVSDREFRLTNKFTASGSKAFAICKGVMLVQPQTGDTNKVNVILRPFTQPITGFNVKYFIYRGLQKSDFFLGDQVITPTASTSDFINKVNASFLSFHNRINPGTTPPTFMARFLGYDPLKQNDDLLLSDFFFKESEYVESNGEFIEKEEMAFELPVIEMGASLGNFASGECGIDIVLNYGDYRLPVPNDEFVFDLAYARANEAKIILPAEMDVFQQKLKREHIFQFLDAAAYFGFHTDNGTVKVDNAGVKVAKKGLSIYNEVIDNFYTKNRLYLYIQSDRTRSYNFYGNYNIGEVEGMSLKMGTVEMALTDVAYEKEKWPLLINDAVQTHTGTRNKLFLQLVTDNNVNTMLYGQVARIDNAQHNNFCNADDLRLPDSIDGVPSRFTKIIVLSNPATGSDGAKVNIASFNILLYQGKRYSYVEKNGSEDESSIRDVNQPNFFNDIFDLHSEFALLRTSTNSAYSVLSKQRPQLIKSYNDMENVGLSVAQTSTINDLIETNTNLTTKLNRVTYTTELGDTSSLTLGTSRAMSISADSLSSASGGFNGTNAYNLNQPFFYGLTFFTDESQTITGLVLKTTNDTIPSKVLLGITKAENDSLKLLLNTQSLSNVRLHLKNVFIDANEVTISQNTIYQKYRLGIVGESNSGQLQLYTPESDIIIYSLDRRSFFSSDYSKYFKDNSLLGTILTSDIFI
ncbi:hypothetical protein BFS30_01760 [Pedobacter steynii]|uniref:Uncharacterized protein n=2 Tax=Pedobacter steynii TaxID=430522 RepID=A0A1D7QBN3_9SPHI|nr:hypothetical protein BFS30_01760 [Pedobacter steynii]